MVSFITVLIAMLGVWLGIRGYLRTSRALVVQRQYEFANRTASGTVQFASFEEAKGHGRRNDRLVQLIIIWGLLAMISATAIVAVFGWSVLGTR